MIIKAKMNLIKCYKRLQPQNKWLEKFAFCPPSLQLFVQRKEKNGRGPQVLLRWVLTVAPELMMKEGPKGFFTPFPASFKNETEPK